MSFAELLQDLVDQSREDGEVALVARVESYDAANQTADVRPLARKIVAGEETQYPVLSKIPVVPAAFGGGFFVINPYESGDLVWVSFSLRDVYGPIRGADSDSALGASLHNAAVVGGVRKSPQTSADWSKPGIVIGHNGGGALLQITDQGVKLTATQDFEIEAANLKITGDVQITGDVEIEGAVDVEGDVAIDGDLSGTGDAEFEGDVIAESQIRAISLINHGHVFPFGPSISKIPDGEA
jgi:hypothetical protein